MTIFNRIRDLFTFPKIPAPLQVITTNDDIAYYEDCNYLADLADTIYHEIDLNLDADPDGFETHIARPLMQALAFPVINNNTYAEKTDWPLDVIALELSWWHIGNLA